MREWSPYGLLVYQSPSFLIGKLQKVEVETVLRAYQDLVMNRLETLLPPSDSPPETLHEAMRYACLAPGKRLRPALCLASCEAVGGSEGQAMDIAAAIEMVHVFSLIHDDLPAIDDDDFRRGRKTCHKQFGEAIAILAGDALFALAFESMAKSQLSAEQCVSCLRVVSRASGSNGLVGGEVVDVESEGKPATAATVEWIHSRKTGSLISACCETGAIAGCGSPLQIDRLREFGDLIGLAFQITDDILNETSSAEELGKSVGSDRARKKATYPGLYGLESSRTRAEELVDSALQCLQGCLQDDSKLIALARYSIDRIR